eukprot:6335528-Amphidinium_carterae.1
MKAQYRATKAFACFCHFQASSCSGVLCTCVALCGQWGGKFVVFALWAASACCQSSVKSQHWTQ